MLRTNILVSAFILVAVSAGVSAQFSAPTAAPFSPAGSWVVLDLDGDGDDDVVFGSGSGPSFIYTAIAPAFYPGPFIPTPAGTVPVAAGDVDGDGDSDIIGVAGSSIVVILVQSTIAPYYTLPNSAGGAPELVDYDGDDDLDLVFGTSWIMRNNGSGTFGASEALDIPITMSGPVIRCDVDGDGDLDYLGYRTVNGVPTYDMVIETVRQDAGTFHVADVATILGASGGLKAGDFDGDGDMDLVSVRVNVGTSNEIRLLRNIGGTFVYGSTTTLPGVAFGGDFVVTDFAAEDLNKDGLDDLVLFAYADLGLQAYYYRPTLISTGAGFTNLQYGPSSTVSMSGAVFGRFVGAPSGGRDLLSAGFINGVWLGIVASNGVSTFGGSARINVVSGDGQSGRIGTALGAPLVVSLTNSIGIPYANLPVTFVAAEPGVSIVPATVLTDSAGFAAVNVTLGAAAGPVHVTVTAASARPAHFSLTTTGLRASAGRVTTSLTTVALDFVYDRMGVPVTIAADAPLATPFSTPFGPIWTTLLNPGPTLFVLDGLGIVSPPIPGLVTSPNLTTAATIDTSYLVGNAIVFQGYAYDFTRPFPENVVISNPVTLSF